MDERAVIVAVEKLLQAMLGFDILSKPDFKETPKRVMKYFKEMIEDEKTLEEKIQSTIKVFPSTYKGLIILPGIKTHGLCPHHLLPVEYTICIGYIPKVENDVSQVIGASKPERISRIASKNAILQENLTTKIVQCMEKIASPEGIGVIVKGEHSCMRVRGIKNPCSSMITSEMYGSFKNVPAIRDEFFQLISWGERA